jgi:hypothetical protein
VGGQVVHHDDHAGPQGGDEHRLDIGEEGGAVHGPVEHHWRGQTAQREGRDEGNRLPVSVWDRRPASLPAGRPPAKPRHLRRCSGFVDEDQVLGVQVRLRVEPGLAPGGDIGPLLLAGVCRFF